MASRDTHSKSKKNQSQPGKNFERKGNSEKDLERQARVTVNRTMRLSKKSGGGEGKPINTQATRDSGKRKPSRGKKARGR